MVRKRQTWRKERQAQNKGKYSKVLRDRMVTGIAVGAGSAHVLPHLGQTSQYLPQLSYFFKIKARKVLVFLFHSMVPFFLFRSFSDLIFVFLWFFFNYLDLAFPIPHLVTVWTEMNSQSPKPICDFYGAIPNYLISAHMPVHIHSLTSFFSLELGTGTASWLRCKNNTQNTEAKPCTISLHMWLGTNKQVRKWSI